MKNYGIMGAVRRMFIAAFIGLFLGGMPAYAGAAGDVDAPPKDKEEWTEEVDGKLDKAIEILSVIKEEIKESKEADKSAEAKGDEEGSAGGLSKKIKAAAGSIRRIWQKIRNTSSGEGAAQGPKDDDWSEDLKLKMDKTIEAMQVIREELDKVDAQDAKPASGRSGS